MLLDTFTPSISKRGGPRHLSDQGEAPDADLSPLLHGAWPVSRGETAQELMIRRTLGVTKCSPPVGAGTPSARPQGSLQLCSDRARECVVRFARSTPTLLLHALVSAHLRNRFPKGGCGQKRRPFYTLVATPSHAPACRARCSAAGLHKNQCVAQIRKGFLVVKNAPPQIRLPESTGACKCSRTAWAVRMLVTAQRRRVGVRGADV